MNTSYFTNRQSIVKVCVVWMLGLAVLLGSATVTLARDNKKVACVPDSYGCCPADYNSPGGKRCMAQQDADVAAQSKSLGHNYMHNMYCDGHGGKECCLKGLDDNSAGRGSCLKIQDLKLPGAAINPNLSNQRQLAPGAPAPSFSPAPPPNTYTVLPGNVIPRTRGVEPESPATAPTEQKDKAAAPK